MSQRTNHFYEFEGFRLDAGERLLLRDGEVVALTPKAFDLLLALVKGHGHLLEKEELFKTVWPDTFVEESNLSSNIALIRKTLGGSGNGERYIETVPKRGYRFVAEVREVRLVADGENSLAKNAEPSADAILLPTTSQPEKRASRRTRLAFILVPGALMLSISAGVWIIALRRSTELPPPKITPFTTFPGGERSPSFSPDGNAIAFSWDGEKGDNRISTSSKSGQNPCSG